MFAGIKIIKLKYGKENLDTNKKERYDGIAIIDVDVSEFYSENGDLFVVNILFIVRRI